MKTRLLLGMMSLLIGQLLSAQSEVLGFWKGKMQSEFGKYEFRLTVQQQPDVKILKDGSHSNIKAFALHNRQGVEEVIELNGISFGDRSIYFRDVNNRFHMQDEDNGKFSRLQFILKFERGEAVLDGHWQEYRDPRRYRKGRLVLKKSHGKA